MIRVHIPATSANLGPGFDFLGLALDLYNIVEFTPDDQWIVTAEGYDAERLSGRTDLLVCRAVRRVYAEVDRPLAGGRIHLCNKIPDVGGLGSSAAAIVGGLAAANRYLGDPLPREVLLQLATELEGHPDNVAPAIYGGLVAVYQEEKKNVAVLKIPFPEDLRIVLVIPQLKVSTEEARRLLPREIPLSDAVFNLSRTGLLIGACFAGRPELLRLAMSDRLHQPYRAALIPGLLPVLERACRLGAYGAALSGSGPTVIAFVAEDKVSIVGDGMKAKFAEFGVAADWLNLPINHDGYRIL